MSTNRAFACLAVLSMLTLGCGSEPPDGIELPAAPHARVMKAPEVGPYPTLTIAADGTVGLDGVEFAGFMEDDSALVQALGASAREMPMVPLWEGGDKRIVVPGNPVLIRADRAAPFGVVKRVMWSCNNEVVRLWLWRIAALAKNSEGVLEFELLRDISTCQFDPMEPFRDLATLANSSGTEVHIWRTWYPSEKNHEPAPEFQTSNVGELTNYLAPYAEEGRDDIWLLHASDDVRWEDVVLAIDAFVAAGLRILLPMELDRNRVIEARSR